MDRNWTFGEKVGGGFALVVILTLVIGAASTYALHAVVASKDRVISVNARNITDTERLAVVSARRVASVRGYLLTKHDRHLEELQQHREQFQAILAALRRHLQDREGRRLVEDVARAEDAYRIASEKVIDLRRSEAPIEAVIREFDATLVPKRDVMSRAIDALANCGEQTLDQEKQAASAAANSASSLVVSLTLVVVVLAAAVAVFLTRALSRQIGTAVGHVRSSSAELQAAASQQAAGAKEQATATSEITTTIGELFATSRQIAESAQRVAQIAGQTAGAASAGDATVRRAHEAIVAVRRQVDAIVGQMLELGKKSQEIGAVLNIVSELAEQTNILAINATIEAAHGGEGGNRFSAVAQEIRNLADRVAGSTKEVRGLIEEVRGSVNTTIMTTEAGTKAVASSAQQFAEVASAFKQIAALVATTTEAAREIELSTKQQAAGAEQVNAAVVNMAQASRETEVSTSQTLQTASQLSGLSRDLLKLVQHDTSRARRGLEAPAAA